MGLDVQGGFGPEPPEPFINPHLEIFLESLLIYFVFLGLLLADWKFGKQEIKPWQFAWLFTVAYLVSIIAMAYFRSDLTGKITAGFV